MTAVINLVIDAIGETLWPFLLTKTWPVFWSITKATLECSSGPKPARSSLRPRICPKPSRCGMDTRTIGDGAVSIRRTFDGDSVVVVVVANATAGFCAIDCLSVTDAKERTAGSSSLIIGEGDAIADVAADAVTGSTSDEFSCLTICKSVCSCCIPVVVAVMGSDVCEGPLLCASRTKACRYCCRAPEVSSCCFPGFAAAGRCMRACTIFSCFAVFSAWCSWAISCVNCCF